MPIITKPSSISKNVAASFSLSKSELATVASVICTNAGYGIIGCTKS